MSTGERFGRLVKEMVSPKSFNSKGIGEFNIMWHRHCFVEK
jgi:hypothetical protein